MWLKLLNCNVNSFENVHLKFTPEPPYHILTRGVGWWKAYTGGLLYVLTVYPAESWAQRVRAHVPGPWYCVSDLQEIFRMKDTSKPT